jgi:hypothetical protein
MQKLNFLKKTSFTLDMIKVTIPSFDKKLSPIVLKSSKLKSENVKNLKYSNLVPLKKLLTQLWKK